jgi:hypothetical protein
MKQEYWGVLSVKVKVPLKRGKLCSLYFWKRKDAACPEDLKIGIKDPGSLLSLNTPLIYVLSGGNSARFYEMKKWSECSFSESSEVILLSIGWKYVALRRKGGPWEVRVQEFAVLGKMPSPSFKIVFPGFLPNVPCFFNPLLLKINNHEYRLIHLWISTQYVVKTLLCINILY